MKKVVVGNCSICGKKATVKTRLNPDSYIIGVDKGGYIEYEWHLYCENHFNEVIGTLWKRIEDIW